MRLWSLWPYVTSKPLSPVRRGPARTEWSAKTTAIGPLSRHLCATLHWGTSTEIEHAYLQTRHSRGGGIIEFSSQDTRLVAGGQSIQIVGAMDWGGGLSRHNSLISQRRRAGAVQAPGTTTTYLPTGLGLPWAPAGQGRAWQGRADP